MILFARMYKKPYWIVSACNGFLGFLLYNLLLFRCIPGKTRLFSEIILVLFLLIIGGLFTFLGDTDKDRTLYNIILNTLFSLELYWLFSEGVHKVSASLIKAVLLVGITVIVGYGFKVFGRKAGNPKIQKRIESERWNKIANFGYQIAVVFYLILLVYSAIDEPAFVKKKAATSSVPQIEDIVEEDIEHNMDTLILLKEDSWPSLPEAEKVRVLQTVADIQVTTLGVPFSVTVVADHDDVVPALALACYIDEDHSVYMKEDHLTNYSAKECVDSIAHEVYHAYQHAMLEAYDSLDPAYQNLLLFDPLRYYQAELDQYIGAEDINNSDDYHEYKGQLLETHARNYASIATENLFETVERYINAGSMGSIRRQN